MRRYWALSLAATREVVRNRVGLFFTFVFPLIFLVTFGLLFGHQKDGTTPYINYIGPGILAWAVGNGALFGVAYTLMHWRKNDLLRVIRMTPITVPEVLGARGLVALGVGICQAVFFVVISALPFFGMTLSRWSIATLPVVALGVCAFFAMGLLVGTYASSSEAIAAIANCIMVPMAFLSGTFFPVNAAPGWVQGISRAMPLRYMIDGLSVLPGSNGPHVVIVPCLVLIGFTVVFGLFATRLFRWSSEA